MFRSVFEKVLTIIVNDKLSRISVRLETEFLSDKAEFDVGLVPINQLVLIWIIARARK